MRIFIDGDSCSKEARQIVEKRAQKEGLTLWVIADRPIKVAPGETIHFLQVPQGEDAVDREILREAGPEDLIITRDVVMAGKGIEQGKQVINDRGVPFSEENIGERLSQRNWSLQLKEAGLQSGGGRSYSSRDKQNFANTFDRWVIQSKRF